MLERSTDIAILGCGAAGTAIASILTRTTGLRTTVIFRSAIEGSSFSNQKWKHSGALYPARDLAFEAWSAFRMMDHTGEMRYILSRGAQFLSDDASILERLRQDWSSWDVASWGLTINPLDMPAGTRLGSFGRTRLIGGFLTPDCVLDFPQMIHDLRAEVSQAGAILEGETEVVALLREHDRVTGVVFRRHGRDIVLRCRQCIVAMGAWSLSLLQSIGVTPPVRLTKSNVAVFDGELVDRITVWIRHELTIVPFRGKTLVCDARYDVITDATDLGPYPAHLAGLLDDLRECFPDWVAQPESVHGCIKTSGVLADGLPNPRSVTFQAWSPTGYAHGVEGLTVVFPGKASFMWPVAEKVAAQVLSSMT